MKKNNLTLLTTILFAFVFTFCYSQNKSKVITGANQMNEYLPLLKGKNVAMAINNSSTIGGKSSLDSLLSLGINVVKLFTPEHGLRGINEYSSVDEKTGIPIVDLYRGDNRKPTKEDMSGIDIMIFEMQNVGTKFYTYKATLRFIMEACAENDVELIVFDRPNPNDYVDGPINEFENFVGMDPTPILHGMTMGEYALMLNGEGWLENGVKCNLKVIEVLNWKHGDPYILPIPPSPNLNTQQSILLYASLCLFEGTVISEGRGTCYPFTIIGHPEFKDKYTFSFYPVSIPTMSTNPKHLEKVCYGLDLRNYDTEIFRETGRMNLGWIIEFYNAFPDKNNFWRAETFDRLAGTSKLREQIIAGKTEQEIRESWEPGLSQYKKIREKYLIY